MSNFSGLVKVSRIASVFILALTIQSINWLNPNIPKANAAKGPVKLCNGDTEESVINAAILYFSIERNAWMAQGWYVIQPGKCVLVVNYEGGMFAYAERPSRDWTYSGSGSVGFCASQAGFSGKQKTKCKSNERFLKGIEINVPSNGGGLCFTFGDSGLIRDDDSGC